MSNENALHPELIYSGYYKNPIDFNHVNEKTNITKKIGQLDRYSLQRNRTICGIHRAIYKYIVENMNISKHEDNVINICEESLWRSNEAVLELRKYKKNFDTGWWEHAKNTPVMPDGWWENSKYYKSKMFTEDDIKFSMTLLDTKDNILMLDLIRKMYKNIDTNTIKMLCLEVLWMSYRINKKLYEYETK